MQFLNPSGQSQHDLNCYLPNILNDCIELDFCSKHYMAVDSLCPWIDSDLDVYTDSWCLI